MPIFPDPSKLTVVKLKEELRRYNVKLPPSGAKKQAYVDLYTQHVSQLSDPNIFEDDFDLTEQSLEPSAESENESATDSGKEQDSDSDNESVPLEESEKAEKNIMNVEDLTDKQLSDELRSLGFKPGPIGATTRRVHEKKLVKMRLSAYSANPATISPKLIQPKFSEVPDDEDKQPPAKPRSPKRRPPPRRVPIEDPVEEPEEESDEEQVIQEPELTRRPLSARQNRTREPTGRSKPPPTQKNNPTSTGGIPMWVKLLVFLLIAFFVYLVIVNMEPSADNKIPKSISDET